MSISAAINAFEKAHYPFAAYPKGPCKSVFFPGCSLMSQFPRTTDALADLCREMGTGVAYDCCAASVAPVGPALGRMRRRLARLGCEELVLACPNCHSHLQKHLDIRCVSIYEKLGEWLEGPRADVVAARLLGRGNKPCGVLFPPCPDRESRRWERTVRDLADLSGVPSMKGVPCCGLRPDIAAKGADVVRRLDEAIFAKAGGETVYAVCASCAGQFGRMGYEGQVRHVLGTLFGVEEAPDCAHAILNRARRKFDRGLEPMVRP